MKLREPPHGGSTLAEAIRRWGSPPIRAALARFDAKRDEWNAAFARYRDMNGRPDAKDPSEAIVPAGPIIAEAFAALLPPDQRLSEALASTRDLNILTSEMDELWAPIQRDFHRGLLDGDSGNCGHRFGRIAFAGPYIPSDARALVQVGFWKSPNIKWGWEDSILETASERLINVRVYLAEDVEAWNDHVGDQRTPGALAEVTGGTIAREHHGRPPKVGRPLEGITVVLMKLDKSGDITRETPPATAFSLLRDEIRRRNDNPAGNDDLRDFNDGDPVKLPIEEPVDSKQVADARRRVYGKQDKQAAKGEGVLVSD